MNRVLHILTLACISAMLLFSNSLFSQKRNGKNLEKKVAEIMENMSVRDKIAQLFVIEISRNPSPKTKMRQDSLISEYGVGNIIVMRGSAEHFIDRVNYLQSISKIPLMVALDAEWGAAMRFSEYLSYPRQAQLGRIEKGSEKLLYKMGRNVGKELRDLNIFINFAPVADVSSPTNPADYQRSFSGDPEQVAELSAAYMRGMQDEGIYACGKHFPGHGNTTVDSHYDMPVIGSSREYLHDVDLRPYYKMISDGLEMIMVGHLSVPAIDSSGVPMSISKECMENLIRRDLGFKGVVITDAIPMKGLSKELSPLEANIAVYKAGADMLLMPLDVKNTIEAIADSVRVGAFSIETLNAKVHKVLMLKARAGYFDDGFSPIVTALDEKIRKAQRRDRRLIGRMKKKMLKSRREKLEPIGDDKTLLLDNAGK